MNSKKLTSVLTILFLTFILIGSPCIGMAAEKPIKLMEGLKLGTSAEGSNAYNIAIAIERLVEKYIPGAKFHTSPTSGSLASIQLFGKATGELDACCGMRKNLAQAYKGVGPFAKHRPKLLPYVGLKIGTVRHFILTKANRNDINHLRDLKGKKIFPCPAGTGNWTSTKDVLKELGIWNPSLECQLSYVEAADGLQLGTFDAFTGYVVGLNLPSWLREVESRVKLKMVVPTEEEQKAFTSAGYGVIEAPLDSFSQDLGVDKVAAWPMIWGFFFGPQIDEESAYQVIKVIYEHLEEFKELAPTAAEFVTGGVDFQKMCLDMYIRDNIPIHPGLAKYMKEVGKFNPKWQIGE